MITELNERLAKPKSFATAGPFALECGRTLPGVRLAYRTWGELNAAKDNCVWVLHALTGDSDAATWWSGLIGPGKAIDTRRYFVVCANMLGSCYGSTGPQSLDPRSGSTWYLRFPLITTRDIVLAFRELRKELGIAKLHAVIGGSMGGQQALEWAAQEPDGIARVISIAANAFHSPWGIAFNVAQRMALEADTTFHLVREDAGSAGLAAARAMAMITYRTPELLNERQYDEQRDLLGYKAESYLRHQGVRLVQRFNAHSYFTLTRAMDSHDIGRDRGGAEVVLHSIPIPALVVGIASDVLFPTAEQRYIAEHLPNATYVELDSAIGHDGFLLEQELLSSILTEHELFP